MKQFQQAIWTGVIAVVVFTGVGIKTWPRIVRLANRILPVTKDTPPTPAEPSKQAASSSTSPQK